MHDNPLRGSQPPLLHPDYRSTVLRAPMRPLIPSAASASSRGVIAQNASGGSLSRPRPKAIASRQGKTSAMELISAFPAKAGTQGTQNESYVDVPPNVAASNCATIVT